MFSNELIKCVKESNAAEVKRLLSLGADPNTMVEEKDKWREFGHPASLLLCAVDANDTETAMVLLEDARTEVDKGNVRGYTPLMSSCSEGNLTLFKGLLARGANPRARHAISGKTVLHYVAENPSASVEMAATLLARGLDVNDDDNTDTITPLAMAAEQGGFAFVEFLITHAKADIEKGRRDEKHSPLYKAAVNNHYDIAKLLLDHGAKVDSRSESGFTPLIAAPSDSEDLRIHEALLARGADVNAFSPPVTSSGEGGWTALHYAASTANLALIELLLSRGADVNVQIARGLTPLYLAANPDEDKRDTPEKIEGYVRVIQRLLRAPGIDVNLRGEDTRWMMTPLNGACWDGVMPIVRTLLADPRVDVNKNDYYDNYPLITAAREGHVEVVKALLERDDIDVNIRSFDGSTAIEKAADEGHGTVVSILEADPRCESDAAEFPLHAAAKKGNLEVLGDLDLTSLINSQNSAGQTPLMLAVKGRQTEMVARLVGVEDIDLDIKNYNGSFALYDAAEKGYAEIVDILLNAGADPNETHPGLGDATPLFAAVNGADPEDEQRTTGCLAALKRLLADPRIDVNKARRKIGNDGYNPLISAAKGLTAFARELLAHPMINPNVSTAEWNGGWTPLCLAAKGSHEEIVSLLLAHPRTDVNCLTAKKNSAISFANNPKILEMLLARPEIKVDTVNSIGNTCLHIHSTDSATLPLLIDIYRRRGLSLDPRDAQNSTPLMSAAEKGAVDTTKLLLEAGAGTDFGQLMAYYHALRKGHVKAADFIQTHVFIQRMNLLDKKLAQANAVLTEMLEKKSAGTDVDPAHIKAISDELEKLKLEKAANDYIYSNPALARFCFHLEFRLASILLLYISNEYAAHEEYEVKSKVALLEDHLSLPALDLVHEAIANPAYAIPEVDRKKVAFLVNLIKNKDSLSFEIQNAARLLAFKYEQQIKRLKDQTYVEKFADCVVKLFLLMIKADVFDSSESLSKRLLKSLPTFPFTLQHVVDIGTEKIVTDKDLFQASGVVTIENQYYKAAATAISRITSLGFRLADMEEVTSAGLVKIESEAVAGAGVGADDTSGASVVTTKLHSLKDNPFRWKHAAEIYNSDESLASIAPKLASLFLSSIAGSSVKDVSAAAGAGVKM